MHDIDRTRQEMEWESDPYEGEGYEYEGEYGDSYEYEDEYAYDEFEFDGDMGGEYEGEYEYEYEFDDEFENPLSDAEEMELAADLLEVMDDQEMDQFLGKVFKRVGRRLRKAVPRSFRRTLGRRLRKLARRGLGIAGTAVGGPMGGLLASGAGRALGLELEGLSPEDQEYEVARRFTRLAAEAVKQATKAPPSAPPEAVAQKAIKKAIQKHAPAMGSRGRRATGRGRRPQRGSWVRRGNSVVLRGVFRGR